MAVIAKLSTGVRPLGMPGDYEQIESKLGAVLNAGDSVRFDTTTGYFVAASSADTPATAGWVGILLTGGVAGDYATAVEKGEVAGFDLSALAFGAQVFVSATPGAIDTATSGTTQVIGKVYPGRANGNTFDKLLKLGV